MNGLQVFLAQVQAPAAGAAQGSGAPQGSAMGAIVSFAPFIIIIAFFIFINYRTTKKEKKKKEEMLDSIRAGDKVLTLGGLFGHVASIKDDRFVVKIADNVKIEVAKNAIVSVEGKEEGK